MPESPDRMTMVERICRDSIKTYTVIEAFDALPEKTKNAHRKMVRAIIAAMREPTEAMERAAWDWLTANGRTILAPDEAWRAMIDAALTEGEK